MAGRVLIVCTNHSQLGDTNVQTGIWVEEVAAPYYTWRLHGYHVTLASVSGGEIPFDPASKEGEFATPDAKAFLQDGETQQLVKSSKSVAELLATAPDQYDALFIPGGHGIVFDGPQSNTLKALIESFYAAGKVIAAVCHGPAALVTACGPDGNAIVKGKMVTGFSNNEEVAVQKHTVVPFLLEDKLKELGAQYMKADADWLPYVVKDGKLVTGQNPASSKELAEAVIQLVTPPLSGPMHGKDEGFHHRPRELTREQHHDHHVLHPIPGAKAVEPPVEEHPVPWHRNGHHAAFENFPAPSEDN